MGRPRSDGSVAHEPRRRKLTELFVKKTRPEATVFNTWDSEEPGLVLRIQPGGGRSFKVVYRRAGKPCWYHLGDARSIGLADARRLAKKVMLSAIEGGDPCAERKAERAAGTFTELADRYLAEYAKKTNKSWRQARWLVEKYLLPEWGKRDPKVIARKDVRALMGKIEAPILANQILASASAIFSWGAKQDVVITNPCFGIDRNKTQSRSRILSDSEVPIFWNAFDSAGLVAGSALKVILLTGQRPGEVAHMRCEHIVDGWWEMPGEPAPKQNWLGTKNGETHRVWLAEPVRQIIDELIDDAATGSVFGKAATNLDGAMREICTRLNVENRARPHDLRRTFGSMVTAAEFGRPAMNRILNHADHSIGSVYDRHSYAREDKHIMESVAAHILALVDGRDDTGNVVHGRFNRS